MSSIFGDSLVLSPHGVPIFLDSLKLCKVMFTEITQRAVQHTQLKSNIWAIKGQATDWPVTPLVKQKEDGCFTEQLVGEEDAAVFLMFKKCALMRDKTTLEPS